MSVLRRQILLLACLAALALFIRGAAVQWTEWTRENRGVAVGPDLPVLNPAEAPWLGINAALQDQGDDGRGRALQLLSSGGYAWVRQPFPWRDIEPVKGDYRWERWDLLVDEYLSEGLRVLAVLDRPPSWSRRDNNWPNRPPDNFDDFGDFVAAFAGHYAGKIDYLQIWDEPNIFPNWGNRPIDPKGFGELLAVAYKRAKAANPVVMVLLAGLSPNAEQGGRNMSDLLFLDALYLSGAGRFFDIAAAKPYGLWYSPDDRSLAADRANLARMVLWRETMVVHGDAGKPIWAVEFGWNSLPPDWTGRPSPWGVVNESDQARFTVAALSRARLEWPWLQVMMLQGVLPGAAPDDPVAGFAIADANGRPRPVYGAVKNFAATSRSAAIGFHPPTSAFLEVFDVDAGLIEGERLRVFPGGVLRLRFFGDRLDMLVEKDANGASAIVSVDGKPIEARRGAHRFAALDSYSARPRTERVTIVRGLSLGEHELTLSAMPRRAEGFLFGDEDESFTVNGFYVVRSPDYGRLWLFLPFLLLIAFVLARQLRQAAADWPLRAVGRSAVALSQRAVGVCQPLSDTSRDVLAFEAIAAALLLSSIAPLPLAPLLGLAILVAVWRRPDAAAYALIASAPFTVMPVRLGEAQVLPTEIVALAAVAVLGGKSIARHARATGRIATAFVGKSRSGVPVGLQASEALARIAAWLSKGFNGPIVLLLVAAGTATFFAPGQREALRELRVVILEPLVLYMLVLRPVAGRGKGAHTLRAIRLVDVLVVVGAATAAVALLQYFLNVDVITAEGVRRVRGFYGSPNNLGLFLGRIVPLALVLAFADRRRRWHMGAAVVMLGAVGLTFSVGAWLGLGAATLFVAVLLGWKAVVATAVGWATAVAGALALIPAGRLASHLSFESGTNRFRLQLWQSALDMIRDRPVFGVGPDNFLQLYRGQYIRADAWEEPNLSHPHNLLLDFWLRTGLLGFVAAVWLLIRIFSVGFALHRMIGDPVRRALIVGLLASMVDFVVHGLADNSLFLVELALVFWLSLAVLEVLRQESYNNAGAP